MPNCWSTIFPILPKIDGCQVDLANTWRCSQIENFADLESEGGTKMPLFRLYFAA
jgi:hypothetical protein